MRTKKYFWMLATLLMLCGATMITSCSLDDDPTPVPTPEDVKTETFKKISGIRIDECLTNLGIVRMYEFNEDDTFAFTTIHHSDNNDDGVMDEYESISIFNKGTWKALGNTTCTLINESYDAVAVEYQTTHIVKTPELEYLSEGDPTVYKDTLYLIPNPEEGYNFAFQTDIWILKQLSASPDEVATTRWSFGDLWRSIKQKIGETISDAWKWVKSILDKYDPQVTGNSDWMGTIFAKNNVNPKIHEISIPGSHDTFTYNIDPTVGLWAKTQVFNLDEQFDAGIRLFDFRIKGSRIGNIAFFHGPICCQVSVKEAMDKLRELLKKHPGEMVIAMLKFEDDPNQADIDQLKEVLEPFKDILVDPSKYAPDMRYNDCKGKVLLLRRFDETCSKSDLPNYTGAKIGIYCGGGEENGIGGVEYGDMKWKIMKQDLYEGRIPDLFKHETEYLAKKQALIRQNFEDAANPPADRPDTWHINQTSGYIKRYGGIVLNSPYVAKYTNNYAYNYILEHLGEKTGWIFMDYAGLAKEGTLKIYEVQGDDMVKILLQNNYAMVQKGVLK